MSSSKTSAKSDNFTNSIIKSTERMAKWFIMEFIPKATKAIRKMSSSVGELITRKHEQRRGARFQRDERKGIVAGWSMVALITMFLLFVLLMKCIAP